MLGLILAAALCFCLPRMDLMLQNLPKGDHVSGSQSKIGEFSELFSARDGEYWLTAGNYLQNHLLQENQASASDLVLVVFWDRSDAATFYLADAITSFSSSRTEASGGPSSPEILAVELPEDSREQGSGGPVRVQIPSEAWGVSTPVFFDASYRIWKSLGSPPWPGVALVDRSSQKVIAKWSAKAFINETQTTKGHKKIPKILENVTVKKNGQKLSDNVDLTQTLLGQTSYVMDAVFANGSYFLVDAIGNKVLQVSTTGNLIASFGDGNPGFTDGPAGTAQFRFPHRLQFCDSKNVLIVADWGNRAIRRISLETGAVTTLLHSDQPDAPLPSEPVMIGNHLLVTSAFDNKISVLECAPETEMLQKSVMLPRDWLKTSILKSDNHEIAYLSDPASDKLRLLNLTSLIQTQIEAKSLRNTEQLTYRTAARKTTALGDHALSIELNKATNQTLLMVRSIGSDNSEVYQPTPSDLPSVTGISVTSSTEEHGLAWDALAQRICTIELPRKQEDQKASRLSLNHCIDYSKISASAGSSAQADSTSSEEERGRADTSGVPASSSPQFVMKAGTLSDVTLAFELAKDEFFSARDLHLMRTPDNEIYSWNPRAVPHFSYRAPEQAGLASFEFSPVVCKSYAPNRCRRIHRQINVEIRTSYTDAQASLNQRLQL